MELLPEAVIVVIDPDLLLELVSSLPAGHLSSCSRANFVIADYLLQDDFSAGSYLELTRALDSEAIGRLSVPAAAMSDLMSLRKSLVLYQIAAIATAREHSLLFASSCPVVRRKASQVMAQEKVFCKDRLLTQFGLVEVS